MPTPTEQLHRCDAETPESSYGACDSEPCHELATVHHLATEQDVCPGHYTQLEKEHSDQ